MRIINNENHEMEVTGETVSDAILLNESTSFSVQSVITVVSPITGGSIKLQKSNDGVNWSDEGSATTITIAAVVWLEDTIATSKYMRIYATVLTGELAISNNVCVKGEYN